MKQEFDGVSSEITALEEQIQQLSDREMVFEESWASVSADFIVEACKNIIEICPCKICALSWQMHCLSCATDAAKSRSQSVKWSWRNRNSGVLRLPLSEPEATNSKISARREEQY